MLALNAFIAFTAAQTLVFLFYPEVYESLAPGFMDGAPFHAVFLLLGLKEISILLFYSTAALYNIESFIWLTVALRFTTVPFTFYLLSKGAPLQAWGGTIQDWGFATWTAVSLYKRSKAQSLSSFRFNFSTSFLFVRAIVFIVSVVDFIEGYELLFGSTRNLRHPHAIIARPVFGEANDYCGLRTIGYVTILLSLYSLSTCFLSGIPLAFYIAIGLSHYIFYFLANSDIIGRGVVHADIWHCYAAASVIGSALLLGA